MLTIRCLQQKKFYISFGRLTKDNETGGSESSRHDCLIQLMQHHSLSFGSVRTGPGASMYSRIEPTRTCLAPYFWACLRMGNKNTGMKGKEENREL